MRKQKRSVQVLIPVVALVFLAAVQCFNVNNKALLYEEESMRKYINQPVENLLLGMKEKYLSYVFIDEPPGNLIGVSFKFPSNKCVDIYVSSFKYLKQLSMERKWDIELFKREKISDIKDCGDNGF